ncbi:hypothetical protein [Lusitaniella coriacea]|uniref:hypothetical protein n=1 Tax=Lusitaniella coriacea TaxID=1983105 RepID=UPI003CE89D38
MREEYCQTFSLWALPTLQLQGFVKVNIPNGQNETQFIDKLIKLFDEYFADPDALYFAVPPRSDDNVYVYNSNSFVSGLISSAKGEIPDLGRVIAPGYGKPLPFPFPEQYQDMNAFCNYVQESAIDNYQNNYYAP